MVQNVPDPDWKKHGPAGPKFEHGEHSMGIEPVFDFDGPGVDEAERVDGEALIVVRERQFCRREGCDADGGYNHIYTDEAISESLTALLEDVVEYELAEYVAQHATIVDHDGEVPYLGVEIDDEVRGYIEPALSIERGFEFDTCHGRPLEPSPEPHGL